MPKSKTLTRNDLKTDPFPWTVISQRIADYGLPVFDGSTIAESAETEEAALVYAERRLAEGYWVTVYREHWYGVPKRKEA